MLVKGVVLGMGKESISHPEQRSERASRALVMVKSRLDGCGSGGGGGVDLLLEPGVLVWVS
jgi:hypothetical protein